MKDKSPPLIGRGPGFSVRGVCLQILWSEGGESRYPSTINKVDEASGNESRIKEIVFLRMFCMKFRMTWFH